MSAATGLTLPETSRHLLSGWRAEREGSPSCMLMLSRQGRVVHANPEWFRLVEELHLSGSAYQLQGDYVAASLDGWGRDLAEIRDHGLGVAAIMRGGTQQLPIIYSGTGERRWFSVVALPLEHVPEAGVLVMHHEVTDDILREQSLARRAFFDALTELPNYALFRDRLNHAISQSARSGEPLATMFIDIDDFKLINDTYGHLSGNHVLKDIGRRLTTCLRECDTVGRLGGDEFGMLLPGISTRDAAIRVAEKILAALVPDFSAQNGRNFHLSASIGIAFCPRDGTSLDDLMHGADRAMYQAKAKGRSERRPGSIRFCETCPEPGH